MNLVCEGTEMFIKCPTGRISIKKAIYGRTDQKICRKYPYDKTDCESIHSEGIVKTLCNRETECKIKVSNTMLRGDPCLYVTKYLEVLFTCVLG